MTKKKAEEGANDEFEDEEFDDDLDELDDDDLERRRFDEFDDDDEEFDDDDDEEEEGRGFERGRVLKLIGAVARVGRRNGVAGRLHLVIENSMDGLVTSRFIQSAVSAIRKSWPGIRGSG